MNYCIQNGQLTDDEFHRYSRQLSLAEVGLAGQIQFKQAKVLCVGAGGLASPALLYLAAAGIGTLGIVENDDIELSNLQRQILYRTEDIGSNKGQIARDHLNKLNPDIQINLHPVRLNKDNAIDILSDYDIILDCTDNFHSRYLINDACFHLKKPFVYASILRFEGQCSVFCASQAPCYRCLFPTPPPPELMPNCAEGGVIGVLPGLLGTIQAMEAIKFILGQGITLTGRLLIIDSLDMQFRELKISSNPDCPLCTHKQTFNTTDFPDISCVTERNKTDEITASQLHNLLASDSSIMLLDVRDYYEHEIYNIGGKVVPVNEISSRISELDPKQHIVVYCKMGTRSKKAAELLKAHGFTMVSTLVGGILSYQNLLNKRLSR